ASDNQCYAFSDQAEDRGSYCLLGAPTTDIAVTAKVNVKDSRYSSFYVGCSDSGLYCLDRLTMRKKWSYFAGVTPIGSILADNSATPLVYFATSAGKVQALTITMAGQQGGINIPESAQALWETPGGGAITVG